MSWFDNAVIYQIYPRSYKDSGNDGIGDLKGIIGKLDYIASLGVDAVWLSPIFKSPMKDYGYDVQDYRSIDPLFGDMDDLRTLIRKAHELDIKVLLDMVLNHTSDMHEWFRKSARREGKYTDFYIWKDNIPNNWKACFGGSAWTYDKVRNQYYLHSFLKEQPDLNWHDEECRKAIFGEVRFYLDMGVDGFRLDVINQVGKDPSFRSNPFMFGETPRPYDMQNHIYDRNTEYTHKYVKEQPDLNWHDEECRKAVFDEVRFYLDMGVDGFRLDVINQVGKDPSFRSNPFMFGETPRPYDMQNHIYDRNTAYTHKYVKELRKVLDSYPERAMVGEIQVQGRGQMEQSASYMGENNDELQMCFEFSLMKQRLNAKNMRAVARRWYELCSLEKGRVPCWVLSNHDNPRAITRAGGDENYARLLAMYLILQRGASVVYYGEEIGMQSKDFPRKEIQDPVGKRYWPVEKGRDGERRPMQWDGSENMGFSEAKPWLEPNYTKDWRHCTVENQENNASSLLNLYRALIRLKKERPEIGGSDAVFTEKVPSGILAWGFGKDGMRTAVILNMSGKTRTVRLDDIQVYAQGMKICLLSNARVNTFIRRSAEGDSIMLPMHYGVVLTN